MSTKLWHVYFSINALAAREIPWEIGADLPSAEAGFIVPSVQEFQIGESSDGTRLRAAAAAWAAQSGDAGFVQVIELFIAEEQRHAAELARFLSINGHGVARSSPGDLAFRLLRHLTRGVADGADDRGNHRVPLLQVAAPSHGIEAPARDLRHFPSRRSGPSDAPRRAAHANAQTPLARRLVGDAVDVANAHARRMHGGLDASPPGAERRPPVVPRVPSPLSGAPARRALLFRTPTAPPRGSRP